jgi:hypothetical protein
MKYILCLCLITIGTFLSNLLLKNNLSGILYIVGYLFGATITFILYKF